MTAPAPHGGQTNRERAAEGYCLNCDTMPDPDPRRVHRAATCPWKPEPDPARVAAEKRGYERGRAEAAGAVAEIAEELEGTAEVTGGKVNGYVFAARLRAVAANLSVPGSQEPQP